ncbi:MAG TPA: tetratricopeptide repeat protein, partial [Thermoanaerobaculia bacterium]|nr:tetratricopeptide repeat protein [Thermoanaerobaculia bacterium]
MRTLASERPQHHLPGLATRLVGHSRILERMGRVEEAIDHGVEATEVFRRLAADRPEAFLPDLARALSALSAAQAAAGRREEALATVEEAIGIRVGLAAGATPWAHLEWIESLESRSELLAAQGRFEDALELQRRVLEERRGPAHGESQEVQRARLAYSLTRLARSLAVLGQDEGALSAGEEAVALYRDLAAAEPIAHTNSLSHALTDLGAQLVSSGRVAEAEAASQEALALLNSRGGQVHLSDRAGLARALGNLGMVHLERGEISRALEVQREVVAGYRHLAQAIPEIYTAGLGLALHRTAATLRNLGRDPEAIESVREALELLEPRSLAAPAVYGAEVAELRSLERELESAEALRKQEREKEKKQSNEDPAPSGSTDDILRVAFRRWVPELSPPSALLRPEYGVVPFHGREQELESLLRWARSADRFAVTLLTGPGGMGKTRLAQEVGLVLSKEGWVAGFLPEQTPVNPEELWTALGWPVGRILLIVDYAEIRRQRLVPLLRFLLTVRTGPVRLLLLARAAHDWWDQLKAEGDGVGELLSGPATTRRPLQPVAASAVDRERS